MFIVLDVEADGAYVGDFSMVSFGAVAVDKELDKTFYGKVKPISEQWNPEALAISGFSREEHEGFDDPKVVMMQFVEWLSQFKHVTFVSDNNGFDWQWMNYYLHKYAGTNPFGFSSRRIGDIYCGLLSKWNANREWKQKYRKTKHTHNPVDDAMGNAEALLAFRDEYDFKFPLK